MRAPGTDFSSSVGTLLRLLGLDALHKLTSSSVTELYTVEGDDRLWVDSRELGRGPSEVRISSEQVEIFLNSVASAVGVAFGPESPMLAAELPGRGGRLQGFRPPVVASPVFVLRKPAEQVLSLSELVVQGFLPVHEAEQLRWALADHKTILVVGGTGTGKTTFLNSLLGELAEVCPEERIAILEDTPELQCSAPDRIRLRTSPGRTLYDLLDAVLRASPHRIVVGEVRDHSALAMLDAWNTGHPGGLATLHANSCPDALLRLSTLIQRAGVPPQPQLVAATVSLIARLAGTNTRTRHLVELAEVRGFDAAAGRFEIRPLYERRSP